MISCHKSADKSLRSGHQQFGVQCMGQDVQNISVFLNYDWVSNNIWWIQEGQAIFCLHLATTRPKKDKDDAFWDPTKDIFGPNDNVWFLLLAMFAPEAQVSKGGIGKAQMEGLRATHRPPGEH